MRLRHFAYPRRRFSIAACSALLALALPTPPALALKVQQAGDSETVRRELRRAGLEEPTAAVATSEVAAGLGEEQGRIPRGQAPVRLDAAIRALPGGPVTRKELAYLAGVPIDRLHEYQYKVRIRRENCRRRATGIPRIALMRSDMLTAHEHLATIRAFLRQYPGGLLRRKTLARAAALSEARLKRYRPLARVRAENRRRRAEGTPRPAINYGLGAAQWARTERRLLATLQTISDGSVSGSRLAQRAQVARRTVRRHDWRHLVPWVNERLVARGMPPLHVRTRAEVSQEFGQRNHALYQEVEDAIRNALTLHPGGRLRLKALAQSIGFSVETVWDHPWRTMVDQENVRRQAQEPRRHLMIAPNPRGIHAGGLEEPTAVVILPEVAGMATAVPADHTRYVFLWEGQPLPPGLTENMVRRLGPKAEDWLAQQTALRNAFSARARTWFGHGVRHLIVVRPAAQRMGDGLKAALGIAVREIIVAPDTIEEAIVQLAQTTGFPPPAGEALSDAAHQVRDYQHML